MVKDMKNMPLRISRRAGALGGAGRWIPLLLLLAAGTFLSFSCARPEQKAGAASKTDLVEIVSLDATIHLDIRYATSNNFVGRPLYPEAKAFLQRPAAEALAASHRWLKERGYGLAVFDAYRPLSVTKIFWDMTPPDKRMFVADPAVGSHHNRGCAVDLTLYDLKTAAEVEMPSAYDEMSERAFIVSAEGTPGQRKARDLLREAMERDGYFFVYPEEWWHYDYKDWREYPVLDIAFSAIKPGRGE
jgi:D-alanyl-D-alanine dipeptidase